MDINQQDEVNPNYRSRFMAKETRQPVIQDSDAATPPSECLRMTVSSAMVEDTDVGDLENPKRIMVCDVSRAYLYAPAVRPVYVKIVGEDLEPGDKNRCGKLSVSMHGTRDAALHWHHHCKGNLETLGFNRGMASPCIFNHTDTGLKPFVHGDDYALSGREEQFTRFGEQMGKQYESEINVLGPQLGQERHVSILNRVLTIASDQGDEMVTYEADPRHAEIIISEFDLDQAKLLTTLVVQDEMSLEEYGESPILELANATQYESLVARANCLEADILDTKYACKELSSSMSKPREHDWDNLRRLGK